ncbi:MAG: hypothetical protein FWD77_10585 [Betaproteobacteria bacterium]|nr:hypothetical protein [Betaproteobacteria bacterium]
MQAARILSTLLATAFFAAGSAQGQPTVNGSDEIDIQTEVTGPLYAQTIKITATPKSTSSTSSGKILMYAAALIDGVGLFFLDESGDWFPFIDCKRTPIIYYGVLGRAVEIEVVSDPTNLTGVAGTLIAVGFGLSDAPPDACADMLEQQRYTPAHIVGTR